MTVASLIGRSAGAHPVSPDGIDDRLSCYILSGARYGAMVAVCGMTILQCAGLLKASFLSIVPLVLDARVSGDGQLTLGPAARREPPLNRVDQIAAADLDGIRRFSFVGDQMAPRLEQAHRIARSD